MKLKELESWLQDIEGFVDPKLLLEQYETPAHIASHMLHTIESSFGSLKDKIVADLGCGCGMLSVGASLLGASRVVGFEIDSHALDTCVTNIEDMQLENVELVQDDVFTLSLENSRWLKAFDTVILNPPFGTKHNQGADIRFLKTALSLSTESVFSLHKTSTVEFIAKKAKEWGVSFKIIAHLRYNLPNTYKFHRKESVDIHVDLIQLSHC